jgi:DNA (cytosine-5)-methyltransferase 1
MKVLNLYSGIGGNRKLWEDVDVTAVEIEPKIANIYQDFFPNDKVIVGDAKNYLVKHFQVFDFIWASPPCPTHSKIRFLWKGDGKNIDGKVSGSSYKLPDMDLYSIILFLKYFFNGKWVVENVVSYYDPLIVPQVIDNHYFWTNFFITKVDRIKRNIRNQDVDKKSIERGFDLSEYALPKRFKRMLLNNCVFPNVGLHIFDCAFRLKQKTIEVLKDVE